MSLQCREFLTAALATASSSLLPGRVLAAEPAPELRPFEGWVEAGREARRLRIEGRLPTGLRGVFYRNGPGLMARAGQRYEHWFDGDGLVQAWRFEDGGVSHRARFVQTAKFQAESAAGRFLVPALGTAIKPAMPLRGPNSMNVANTSVLRQAGRLYALWEGGSAYELDPQTLATLGPRDWAPELAGMPFSAHPKQEADGTVWNFGTMPGRMALYQIAPDGGLRQQAVFATPESAMVHDFAVSQRHLIFLLAPLGLDRPKLREGSSLLAAMQWRAGEPTRVLVVDKADLNRRRIFELPAAMVFHFGNAWDADGQIHLDYVEAPPFDAINAELSAVMRGRRPTDLPSTPRLLHIDLSRGRLRLERRDESVEFPVVDPRVVAQRHRYVFYPTAVDVGPRWGYNGLMRLDIENGARLRFVFGPEVVVEEHVLVPKPGSTREGQGWLLGMGYDLARRQSFTSVFDAEALSAGPLARVWLPYWTPYGFHGRFYPA